ncbi:hypothetical protein LXL04_016559 [Taraxacum kok-saghyz]
MHIVGEERIQADGKLTQPHLVEYGIIILEKHRQATTELEAPQLLRLLQVSVPEIEEPLLRFSFCILQVRRPTASIQQLLAGKWVKNTKPTGSNPKPMVSKPKTNGFRPKPISLWVQPTNPKNRETEFRTQETEPVQKPNSLGCKTQKPTLAGWVRFWVKTDPNRPMLSPNKFYSGI